MYDVFSNWPVAPVTATKLLGRKRKVRDVKN